MEFTIDREIFLKSLSNANGIIEKKTTLPILSNILIEAKESKIKITSTDLDIIYFEEITALEVKQEGSTRKPIYGIHIEEAYPKSIGEVSLGYDQTNTYSKQTVDFAFRRWRQIPSSEL